MRHKLFYALAACLLSTAAAAGGPPARKIEAGEYPSYDRKLEQAAIRIAVARIGELRGALACCEEPEFVTAPDPISTGSISPAAHTWYSGYSVPVGRKPARIIHF